jgi:hypothetical protein
MAPGKSLTPKRDGLEKRPDAVARNERRRLLREARRS